MKINKLIVGVVSLFLIALSNAGYSQNLFKDWKQLGTRVVDYSIDHDVVSLNNTKEAYTSLKVMVKNGSLNMHKATVHFANGDKQVMDFPDVVTTETDGPVIDLKGNDRVIEKVTLLV